MRSPYLHIARIAFRQSLTHRGELVWNWLGSLIYLTIQLALWFGVYRYAGIAPAGLTLQDVWTYSIVLHTTYDLITPGWESPKLLQRKIADGTVAVDLLRPVPLPLALAADCVGRAVYGVFHGIPGLIIIILLRLLVPDSPLSPLPAADGLAWLLFPVSLVLALAVNFELHLIVRLTGFWTRDTHGAYMVLRNVNEIFSGEVFPIWFLPDLMRTAALWLPFQAVANVPYSIYLGVFRGEQALVWLGVQLAWATLLGCACAWVWSRARQRVEIQGG